MKRCIKRKLWLDRRSRRLKKKRKKKRHIFVQNSTDKENKEYYVARAPKMFSFVDNTEETIKYFMDIKKEIEKRKHNEVFFLDSSDVEQVTTDALIFVLAILYNLKLSVIMNYGFSGNLPKEKRAENVYLESGFMNYVNSKKAGMTKVDNKVQILSGMYTDPDVARKICDFVSSRFHKSYIFTIDLYKTLIELMSNTVHHAYDIESLTQPCWYLYAADIGNSIRLTFIDTGDGIPKTVKKKWVEKIIPVKKDSEFIKSALLGESRTETGLYNRGHGLPALYEKVISGKLKKFFLLSGSGCCISVENGDMVQLEKRDYKQDIFGTIFQFEIVNV